MAARLTSSVVDWDNRYRTGWAYGKAPNEFLADAVHRLLPSSLSRPMTALSLGEGQGRNVAFLASLGIHCTAVDSSSVATASTIRLATQRGVSHLVDAVNIDVIDYIPQDESFDMIISIFCMYPPAIRAVVHSRCMQALRPGGWVIIECFSPQQLSIKKIAEDQSEHQAWGMGPTADCLVGPDELCKEFMDLQPLQAREVQRLLREGRFHRGYAICTQFVAVKTAYASNTYQAAVDLVFSEAAKMPAVVVSLPGRDALLANAPALLRYSCTEALRVNWCRYCWCPISACLCTHISALNEVSTQADIVLSRSTNLHWIFLIHPNEFLRSTSSVKLAAQYFATLSPKGISTEVLVFGCQAHDSRLRAALDNCGHDIDIGILYPEDDECKAKRSSKENIKKSAEITSTGATRKPALSVKEFLCDLDLADPAARKRIIIVPDGSWANAAQLVDWIESYASTLSRVTLNSSMVLSYHSPLIEALKAGQGLGRISTLEACALFLREAGEVHKAETLLNYLKPIVDYVKTHFCAENSMTDSVINLTSREHSLLVTSLQATAADCGLNGLPQGIRRCVLCGDNLATPARMKEHLKGQKHCMAVARRYILHGKDEVSDEVEASVSLVPENISCQSIWEKHSTNILSQYFAEPPDVALQRLKEDLKSTEKRPGDHQASVSKGERLLAAARPPTVIASLPDDMRKMDSIKFDTEQYQIYPAVVDLLLRTENLGLFLAHELPSLENFQPRADVFRSFKERQILYNAVCGDEQFLDVYERMVVSVVCPFLKRKLMSIVSLDIEKCQFHYQYPPSLRVQSGDSEVFGRAHRDVEYGHQAGEINFWMPLTNFHNTKTTLWAESKPGLGDFCPLSVNYGEIAVFHGSLCHHYVPPNRSPYTRISIDFRVGVGPFFDSMWELPGTRREHGRRVITL